MGVTTQRVPGILTSKCGALGIRVSSVESRVLGSAAAMPAAAAPEVGSAYAGVAMRALAVLCAVADILGGEVWKN